MEPEKKERKFVEGNAEELTSKPNELFSLVGYQNGSVVSRTIMQKRTGTVTIFSFDKGEGLSEHTAPFDALVYIIDGTAEITIGGEPVVIGKGEMTIMPANIPHALKALTPYKMMLVMIRSD